MSRILMTGAFVGLLSVSAVQAAILDISIAAQGLNYTNLVFDTKLRGDGGLEDWNLGATSGGSMRIYPNFLGDGTTPSGRLNNFLQRFDVSSIPSGTIINSATLTTYFANQTANNRTWTNMHLSRLQPGKAWVETFEEPPGLAGPHFDGSVTWNRQVSFETDPPGVPWATAGATGAADIDLGTTQTFDLVGVAGSATTIIRDIKAWVQDWVNTPTNNTGIVWWGGNFAVDGTYFHFGVKEDGAGPAGESASAAPTLVIDYGINPAPNITSISITPIVPGPPQYCWTNFASGGAFSGAYGATVDSDGTIYVAALGSGSLSSVTPGGVATTLGAAVASPVELVVSTNTHNLYVAVLNTGVSKVVPPYGAGNVTNIDSTFTCIGVGVDSASDTVYAGDLTGHTIRIIPPDGSGGATLTGAGFGFVDNTSLDLAQFRDPCGIAVVVSGGNTNLYVADRGNNRIRKIDIGNNLVTTLAGGGAACADGTGNAAGFLAPTGVTLGPDGHLYVADQDNFVVRKVTLPGGVVTTLGGLCSITGNADGCGTTARFSNVGQCGVASNGTLYVADRAPNSRVSKGTPQPGPLVGGDVRIDFTSEPGDPANLFTLQSSGTVNGTYNDVSATITQEGPPGSFRAVIAPNGAIQFYRIKR